MEDLAPALKVFNLGSKAGVLIYDAVIELRARKPDGTLYKHRFTSKAEIWGLQNGMLLIVSPFNLPLWSSFYENPNEFAEAKEEIGES